MHGVCIFCSIFYYFQFLFFSKIVTVRTVKTNYAMETQFYYVTIATDFWNSDILFPQFVWTNNSSILSFANVISLCTLQYTVFINCQKFEMAPKLFNKLGKIGPKNCFLFAIFSTLIFGHFLRIQILSLHSNDMHNL